MTHKGKQSSRLPTTHERGEKKRLTIYTTKKINKL